MSVKKRPNGSYQVTVCFGGRTYRKTSRHWTHRDAKEYERKWQAQVRDAASGREPERLIADAIERWLVDCVPHLKRARDAESDCRRLLPYVTGRKLAETADVWAEVKADRGKLSAATVNHSGRILRQITRLALREWGWLDRPIIITLLIETPRERFLKREEVEALADAMHSDAGSGYVLLAAYTGMRRSQMLAVTRRDVHDGYIHLDRTGKTKRLQLVPVHDRVQSIAAQLPLPITSDALRNAWDAARQETGIDCRWHDLRHTFASWAVQAGVPLYTVAKILGHSTTAITQRYAHLAPQDLADAMSRIA